MIIIIFEDAILLTQEQISFYQKLLTMYPDEIYKQYGITSKECWIIDTGYFHNGKEKYAIDIKMCMCDEDPPYIDAILFRQHENYCEELACSVVDDLIITVSPIVEFEYDKDIYRLYVDKIGIV